GGLCAWRGCRIAGRRFPKRLGLRPPVERAVDAVGHAVGGVFGPGDDPGPEDGARAVGECGPEAAHTANRRPEAEDENGHDAEDDAETLRGSVGVLLHSESRSRSGARLTVRGWRCARILLDS